MNRISERFRAAGAEHVADFVTNLEEDGISRPFLALENVESFLRSISNQRDNLANLVNFIMNFMTLVHEPNLINVHSFSEIINTVRKESCRFCESGHRHSSPGAIKAAAYEILSVTILAVIEDGIFNRLFQYKPRLYFCVFQESSTTRTIFFGAMRMRNRLCNPAWAS